MSNIPPQREPFPPQQQIPPGQPNPAGTVAVAAAGAAAGGSMLLIIVIAVVSLLVIGMCVIGILIALLLPAVQAARDAARSAQSLNNLKQIGLAMHSYHTSNRSFPPAFTEGPGGQRLQSWRTLILPHLEQQALYEQMNLEEPWNQGNNLTLAETTLPVYVSPRFGDAADHATNYVVITGPDTAFPGANSVKIEDIRDGTTNTVLAIEVKNSAIKWAEPRDVTIDELAFEDEGAPHDHPLVVPRQAVVLFADGSVRRMPMTRELLKQLSTRAGFEVIRMP